MATEAARLERKNPQQEKEKNTLDSYGLLMEGVGEEG
jgi:hypothetical protein